MSGHLIAQLTITSEQLREEMDAAEALAPFELNQNESNVENRLRARETVVRFQRYVDSVRRARNKVHNLNYQWNKVLDKLEGQEYLAERDIYNNTETTTQFLTNYNLADVLLPDLEEKLHLAELNVSTLTTMIGDAPAPAPPAPVAPGPAGPMQRINLPKLAAIRFDGQPKNWPRFLEYFNETIAASTITDVEKMAYLASLMDSEAKQLVDGYEITAANYQTVLTHLSNKYGRQEILIDALLQELNNLPYAGSSTQQFRKTVIEFERITRQLRTQNVDLPIQQLERIIEQKMSYKQVDKLTERKRNSIVPWNMAALTTILNEMSIDMEKVEQKLPKDKPKPHKTLVVNKKTFPCIFCARENHKSYECKTYATTAQRKEKLKEMHRCFRCLKPYKTVHVSSSCTAKCYKCKGNHHSLICPDNIPPTKDNGKQPKQNWSPPKPAAKIAATKNTNPENTTDDNVANKQTCINNKHQALLPTVKVKLINPHTHEKCEIWALLDSAADSSYICDSTVQKLGLTSNQEENIQTETFGGKTTELIKSKHVNVDLQLPDGSIQQLHLLTVPNIIGKLTVATNTYNHINYQQVTPELLIGTDYLFGLLGWMGQKKSQKLCEFKTRLGNILLDSNNTKQLSRKVYTVKKVIPDDDDDDDKLLLSTYWDLETMGIRDEKTQTVNEQIQEEFNKTIRQDESGQYYVNWLMNGKQKDLPTNINLAFWRLKSAIQRLNKDPKLLEAYKAIFEEQERNGIIERVTTKPKPGAIISYLPHQAVITDSKTTPIRIVFDGSAKTANGLSINDVLHDGPMLLPDLMGIMIRFRIGNWVSCSDIQRAFHAVKLNEDQRDLVRFLTPKDWNKPITHDNIQVNRQQSVIFGSNQSPSLLALTIQHHLAKYKTDLDIQSNLYVDNLVQVQDDPEKLQKDVTLAKQIFADAKFNLREHYSNVPTINKLLNPTNETTTKVFGLQWNFIKDTIHMSWKLWEPTTKITKRSVLKFLAAIYDPLGLISPALLPMKLYLQQLWVEKLEWDEEVSQDLKGIWEKLMSKWGDERPELELPRQAATKMDKKELHIFTDASDNCYGVAAYIRKAESTDKPVLIYSRSRLAPPDKTKQKTLSIVRKELLGVVCGVRIAKKIQNEVPDIKNITIWTDSQIVLHQIQAEQQQSIFVKNRVAEITEFRPQAEFRYIQTNLNPADLTTKSQSLKSLKTNQLWWNGPDFLMETKENWPEILILPKIEPISPEPETNTITMVAKKQNEPVILATIGNWNKILAVTNIIVKIANKANKLLQFKENPELLIWKQEQAQFPPSDKTKLKYKLFQDENSIWRLQTRLGESELPEQTKMPIWLPNDSSIVHKLVLSYHEANLHHGHDTVLNNLRQKYWVNKKLVFFVAKKCQKCRFYVAKPFNLPIFAPLPKQRVTIGNPFEAIALDILGPLRSTDGSVYILVFTCLKIRAAHLELTLSTKTEAILDAITKFVARRGLPTFWMSDNAKYFELAAQILKQRYPDSELTWHFITPRAPWRNGPVERLNATIKQALKRTFGRTKKSPEQYSVLITAIESTINNRPLTTMDENPDKAILRPIDFLRPKGQEYIEMGTNFDKEDLLDEEFHIKKTTATELQKQHQSQLLSLNKFWTQWLQEFLPSLMQKNPIQNKANVEREPQVGEVIILGGQDEQPRGTWKLGRINKLIRSKDGIVRTAEIMTTDTKLTKFKKSTKTAKNKPTKIEYTLPKKQFMTRSISQLYPLEVGGEIPEKQIVEHKKLKNEEPVKIRKNPPRAARTNKPYTMATILKTIMVMSCIFAQTTNAQKPMICVGKNHKTLWTTPKLRRCQESQIHNDTLREEQIILYKPNNIEYQTRGYLCRYTKSTVEEETSLGGTESIREIEQTPSDMTEAECLTMIKTRICKFGTLKKGNTIYQTGNTAPLEPPNRFKSLFGPTKYEKNNCILIPITIFAHHGRSGATTSVTDFHQCEYLKGSCHTKPNELAIWSPNITQMCDFVETYNGKALVSDKTMIIPDLQLMITFNKNNIVKTCNKELIHSDQGLAWELQIKGTSPTTPSTTVKRQISQSTKSERRTSQSTTASRQTTRSTSTVSRITQWTTTPSTQTYPQMTTTQTPIRQVNLTNKAFLRAAYLNETTRVQLGITKDKLLANGFTGKEIQELKEIRYQRDKRSTDEFLPADEQFVEHKILQKIRQLAQTICGIINENVDYMEKLLAANPITAIRKLLNRNNILAKPLNQDLMEIEFCHAYNFSEYTILPNPNNCTIPIQIRAHHNKTYFLDRQTHVLHLDSKRAMEEECGSEIYVSLEDVLWSYNRQSGQITKVHETPNFNKTNVESWDFINSDVIVRDLLIKDSQEVGLQEQIIEEMEKAAESVTEVQKEDQTQLKQETWQDDLLGLIIKKYWVLIWRIWVTIICVLQSIAIFKAIQNHLFGIGQLNNPPPIQAQIAQQQNYPQQSQLQIQQAPPPPALPAPTQTTQMPPTQQHLRADLQNLINTINEQSNLGQLTPKIKKKFRLPFSFGKKNKSVSFQQTQETTPILLDTSHTTQESIELQDMRPGTSKPRQKPKDDSTALIERLRTQQEYQ